MGAALSGKKTFLLGLIAVGYGILNVSTGEFTVDEGAQYIWNGALVMAVRAALSKVGK